MQVLLLLAGRSKRFWPLSEKTLFSICGKTILEHQIDRLHAAGLKNITLVGGAHNLKDAKKLTGLPTTEQKDLDLGMLLSALLKIKKGEPVLIVSGNDVIDSDAYRLVIAKSAEADGAILAKRVKEYFPGGYLSTKGKWITGIVEKPKPGKEPSKLVTIVAHVHNDPKALFDSLQDIDGTRDDGYEQALGKLFRTRRFAAAAYDGDWQAVKYPWHLIPLLETFLKEQSKTSIHTTATIHKSAVIDGPVTLCEGVRVLPFATIVGPCVIGPRTIIGNNCLVRASSIGADCVIGFGTEVKSSVLADHVWTHMSYIGESVIGNNVAFGGGSITGNLRLDEAVIESQIGEQRIPTGLTKFGAAIGDGCRLGIHVSTHPGTKIGAGSFISSGAIIGGDIPERSFVTMKNNEVVVRPNRTKVNDPMERKKYRKSL
jgi:bifunctional UDP-N-acetylglucosamine pyrophosphorylase/glucosamine-1-phosphate N-acetyltransferase